MFRQVRNILLKAAMVATEKWTSIIVPRFLEPYDQTWSDQQGSGLIAGRAIHKMVAVPLSARVPCDAAGAPFLPQVANECDCFDM
jgi:hypothetical protein